MPDFIKLVTSSRKEVSDEAPQSMGTNSKSVLLLKAGEGFEP